MDEKMIKRGFQVFLGLIVMMAVFFTAAGRIDIPRAWLFYGLTFINLLCNFVIFLRFAPDIIRERSEIKSDMKSWDKAFAFGYILSLLLIHAIAGLDIGRYGWSYLDIGFGAFGVLLYTLGAIIITWSMVVNRFFETTVTVVEDHQVVTNGPYAFVRHPGYIGMILMYFSTSLIIGSAVSLIPAAILAVLFVARTYLEDSMLQKELSGYKEYTEKVRYRLVPGVW